MTLDPVEPARSPDDLPCSRPKLPAALVRRRLVEARGRAAYGTVPVVGAAALTFALVTLAAWRTLRTAPGVLSPSGAA
ncbi:hypothetical protein [Micromonospora sp. NPDC048839]|uniref:hypothetical protein n=1 Tax=Micromonospora sp. NPDC048839 TaxID=3155641 RepID=UPI0033E37A7B